MSRRVSRRPRPNPSGVHHLRSAAVTRALARSAELRPTDRVFELGAGPGTLTAVLAASGASVAAVERDPRYVSDLKRRFCRCENVSVVAADLRTVRIPRDAKVVANLPFATSGAILAALLDPPGPLRAGIDLLVEHGFALRVSAALPRSARAAWRAARYDIQLIRRVPRTAFAPVPGVDAALLRIRSREEQLDQAAEQRLRQLLGVAYGARPVRAGALARRFAGRRAGPAILRAAGANPDTPAGALPPSTWAAVARGPRPRA